jgi:hypothetical protein
MIAAALDHWDKYSSSVPGGRIEIAASSAGRFVSAKMSIKRKSVRRSCVGGFSALISKGGKCEIHALDLRG